jgi:hypothetical protein
MTRSPRPVFQRCEGTHFKCPIEDPLNLGAIRLEGFSQGRYTLSTMVGQQNLGSLDASLPIRPGFRNAFEFDSGLRIENKLGS